MRAPAWIFRVAVPAAFLASTFGWFRIFPVKDRVLSAALILEGTYLLASILAYFLILRLREWLLAAGWCVFTYGLFIDFLDEITLESGFIPDVDVVQDVLTTIGLALIAGGFLTAVNRRERQILSIRESSRQVAAGKERLAVILASVAEGIAVTDADGKILLLNAAAETLGRTPEPDALGREISAVFPLLGQEPDDAPVPVAEILHRSESGACAVEGRLRSAGETRSVELAVTPLRGSPGEPAGRVWVLKDVTEQRRAERETRNQSRLESIGHLAAGVAHDFNNILAAIQNWVSYLETGEAPSPALRSACGEIRGACKRGKGLSSQLLTFAKGGEPVKVPTELRDLLESEVEFALRGANVTARFQIEPGLWPAEVDPSQIGQVLQNLTINGRQAMPAGGEIRVRAGNVTVPPAVPPAPLAPGRYVRVEISDQGEGIPAEYVERVFEPYFSTKSHGRGLGLAICHSIVKRHAGCIGVASAPGKGTTFTFLLPATDKPPQTGASAQPERRLAGVSILVVDDEFAVRNPLAATLRALGLDVEACAGGDEALDLYRARMERGAPFDVAVIDLTLKDQRGGEDLMRRLLDLHAAAKGVVMTGYHDSPILIDYRRHGFVGALAKPFDYSSLAAAVRSALGAGGSGGGSRP